jgi:hypothetical protein
MSFGSYVQIDEAAEAVAEAQGTAIRGVGKFLGGLARVFANRRMQAQQTQDETRKEPPCPDATPDGGNDCVERSQDLLQKAKEKRLARLRAAQERG